MALSSLWADERFYLPLQVLPYTPAQRLPGGRKDPAFRTKPQLALELVRAALEVGVPFRAVVADSFYGDNPTFAEGLEEAGLPYMLILKPSSGVWAPLEEAHNPEVLLSGLAHNLLLWWRRWLALGDDRLEKLRMVGLVKEVWAVPGRVTFHQQQLSRVWLEQAPPLGRQVKRGLSALLQALSCPNITLGYSG